VQVAIAAQFGVAFSINFVFVFLPFYIHDISPWDAAATLRWTGMIMGAASFVATFVSPVWGYMTERESPKAIFERALLSQAVTLALMAATTNLYVLFGLRLLQGLLGGISTIGIIIVSATSPRGQLAKNMALYQSSMTLGQILGPPVGAAVAGIVGYRPAFVIVSALSGAVFLFSHRSLSSIPPHRAERARTTLRSGQVAAFWGVALAATVQITFLPAILPSLLRGFAVAEGVRPLAAGLIVSAYAMASIVGANTFSRLAPRVGSTRLVYLCGLASAGLQVLLVLPTDVWTFTLIRMAQMACVSALPPLVIANVAERGRGGTLGVVNTSRFAGNALGPIIGTFVLAHGGLLPLYVAIAAFTAIALLAHRAAARA
jgi:DHA1 family multidrug resistance protein-like MFS transporter